MNTRLTIFLIAASLRISASQPLVPPSLTCPPDTTHSHLKIRHFIEAGILLQPGGQFARTHNNYDNTTDAYNNNMVMQHQRFLSLRLGHYAVFKNIIALGFSYGADVAGQPHDVRAFVPLLLHAAKDVMLTKRLALLFTERMGGAFYLRTIPEDPFMHYPPVTGGFTSETLGGLSLVTKHKNRFRLLVGYQLQHLYTKAVFTPGQTLSQGSNLPPLPSQITETTNALYSFIYISLGASF